MPTIVFFFAEAEHIHVYRHRVRVRVRHAVKYASLMRLSTRRCPLAEDAPSIPLQRGSRHLLYIRAYSG